MDENGRILVGRVTGKQLSGKRVFSISVSTEEAIGSVVCVRGPFATRSVESLHIHILVGLSITGLSGLSNTLRLDNSVDMILSINSPKYLFKRGFPAN
jgi:hypothetical protein